MGGNIDSSNYALNINMIGESMYFLYLYLTKNIYTKTKSKDKKEQKSIVDFGILTMNLIHLLKHK